MAMARILVIDDDQVYAQSVCRQLERQGYAAFAAHTAASGLEMVRSLRPDLVLLDIMLPDMDGRVVCERLQELTLAPIVYLTVVDGDLNISKGLDSGDDYCVKAATSLTVLTAKVAAKLRRVRSINTMAVHYDHGALMVDCAGQRVERDGVRVELSTLEGRALFYMVEHAGEIVPHDDLVAAVWGEKNPGQSRNLATLISRLRHKLEPDPSEPRYITNHRGIGYSFVAGSPNDGLLGRAAIIDMPDDYDTGGCG